jgi:hypothetical protein
MTFSWIPFLVGGGAAIMAAFVPIARARSSARRQRRSGDGEAGTDFGATSDPGGRHLGSLSNSHSSSHVGPSAMSLDSSGNPVDSGGWDSGGSDGGGGDGGGGSSD